jgi:hypothetical protein
MLERAASGHSAARSAVQKTYLYQIRLIDFFYRVALFADGLVLNAQ